MSMLTRMRDQWRQWRGTRAMREQEQPLQFDIIAPSNKGNAQEVTPSSARAEWAVRSRSLLPCSRQYPRYRMVRGQGAIPR
jgi:hypothetical protein